MFLYLSKFNHKFYQFLGLQVTIQPPKSFTLNGYWYVKGCYYSNDHQLQLNEYSYLVVNKTIQLARDNNSMSSEDFKFPDFKIETLMFNQSTFQCAIFDKEIMEETAVSNMSSPLNIPGKIIWYM